MRKSYKLLLLLLLLYRNIVAWTSLKVSCIWFTYVDVQYNPNNNIMYNLNHVHAHTTYNIVFVTRL